MEAVQFARLSLILQALTNIKLCHVMDPVHPSRTGILPCIWKGNLQESLRLGLEITSVGQKEHQDTVFTPEASHSVRAYRHIRGKGKLYHILDHHMRSTSMDLHTSKSSRIVMSWFINLAWAVRIIPVAM